MEHSQTPICRFTWTYYMVIYGEIRGSRNNAPLPKPLTIEGLPNFYYLEDPSSYILT